MLGLGNLTLVLALGGGLLTPCPRGQAGPGSAPVCRV